MNKELDRQMIELNSAATDRSKLDMRTGSSRKLLARKAVEKAGGVTMEGEALEASFPAMEDDSQASAVDEFAPTVAVIDDEGSVERLEVLPGDGPAAAAPALINAADVAAVPTPVPAPHTMAPAPAWSAEDESTLQTLLAQRKAAGYQRRGRDVSRQMITAGTIKPNPGTVVSVIVDIVAERGGTVGRAELVKAMTGATFPHAKARPNDSGWCQGYIAGAIRSGFLSVAEQLPSLSLTRHN